MRGNQKSERANTYQKTAGKTTTTETNLEHTQKLVNMLTHYDHYSMQWIGLREILRLKPCFLPSNAR